MNNAAIRVDKAFEATEERKAECRAFLSSLSSEAKFDDDVWYCDKRRRNPAELPSKLRISFRECPDEYCEILRYFALVQLMEKAGIAHVKQSVQSMLRYIRFLENRRLEDTELSDVLAYRRLLDEYGYAESTKQSKIHALSDFFTTMNGFGGIRLRNPFADMVFSYDKLYDCKYIPKETAVQLDRIFQREEIPLHLRCIYWVLRLVPSRISEVLAMKTDCLKPFDDHDCLMIPTWKQNGGYREPIMRVIHIGNGETESALKSILRKQAQMAEIYGEYLPRDSRGMLFTYRQQIELDGKVYDKNRYRVATWSSVSHSFKRLCEKYGVTDADGKPYSVTTHQFRHNGITDRLMAGFTPAQIADMTGHHGDGMMLASYAHLNLFPETIPEPIKYRTEAPSDDNAPLMFCGKILNMDAVQESLLLKRLRSHRIPGGICADVTHCRGDMWNCIDCEFFIPEAEQLSYFEEQATEWEKKAERFSADREMEQVFRRNAEKFRCIIAKIQNAEKEQTK